MAWAFVQKQQASGGGASGSSIAATFGSNVTAGNLIVMCVTWDYSGAGDVTSISDTRSSTWTQIGATQQDTPNTQKSRFYYAQNIPTSGAETVTVNFSNTPASRTIVVGEYSGIVTSSALVSSGIRANFSATTATDNATTNPNSATPTATGQLVVGMFLETNGVSGANITGGSNFNDRATDGTGAGAPVINLEDRSAPSTSAIDATWTLGVSSTSHCTALVAVFAEAAGGSTPTHFLAAQGAGS